ncbi:4Fe-4S binding protein [bacterium]|nr:4Fe-4S binding protein [bacterium]MBU1064171.1 4Fe-4S binding protein [bacterium]MBU1633387.1 4Fe-4S binding protein [bacterium]MBU1874818.1 4Fe-4S binding protein [bacterium]
MVIVNEKICDLCGTCVAVCPVDCIELTEFDLIINDEICIRCNICIKMCPFAALTSKTSEV